MSLFTGKGRVHQYEQVHHLSHLENLIMRSLTLTGAAMLATALLTACGDESGPAAVNVPALTANATDPNTADHFTTVEAVTFELESPCNGELILFSGTAETQVTLVDTREHLDAGFWLHMELQQHTTASGTGSVSGATYTINDIFHEGFESPNPPAPHAVLSAHATTRVTSDLAGLSFLGHFVFQGVIPSGQDFKVTVGLDRLTCS
jgi:hypothetical protein